MPNTSVQAAGEAMPSRFQAMRFVDMRTLFDGLHAAYHILLANEQVCEGTLLTGSYLWFKAEAERLNALMQEIADAALYRTPEDKDDEYEREHILVRAKPSRSGRRIYRTTTAVEVL
ncbi:hypothetical protein WMC41_16115 [Shinella yambaruensis]|uniref:hypothetical protein n=1 Tax=Shinella yambaruensis TaxID=415996 RepID=UPI003D79BD53